MQILSQQLFDDNVAGTGVSWYTPAEYNDLLGSADLLAIQVLSSNVSGTGPTLTAKIQWSGDNQHWLDVGSPGINGDPLANNSKYYFQHNGTNGVALAYARISINLGGTSPAARLRVFVCGRTF